MYEAQGVSCEVELIRLLTNEARWELTWKFTSTVHCHVDAVYMYTNAHLCYRNTLIMVTSQLRKTCHPTISDFLALLDLHIPH